MKRKLGDALGRDLQVMRQSFCYDALTPRFREEIDLDLLADISDVSIDMYRRSRDEMMFLFGALMRLDKPCRST